MSTYQSFKRTVAPAAEPITLSDAKTYLRVDSTAEDSLITNLITAAREKIESLTGRALITQTLELTLDDMPADRDIPLPRPPLQAVNSVTVGFTVIGSASYLVDIGGTPGRLIMRSGKALTPTDKAQIKINYDAGYGDAASDVPSVLRQAMLMLIGHYYDSRDLTSVPQGLNFMISDYKVRQL